MSKVECRLHNSDIGFALVLQDKGDNKDAKKGGKKDDSKKKKKEDSKKKRKGSSHGKNRNVNSEVSEPETPVASTVQASSGPTTQGVRIPSRHVIFFVWQC